MLVRPLILGQRQAAVGLPGLVVHLAGHPRGRVIRQGGLAMRQPER